MFVRGGVPERLVWSDRIVRRFPRSERLLHGGKIEVAVITRPELTPRRTVEAFDPSVELGTARGQDIQGNLAVLIRNPGTPWAIVVVGRGQVIRTDKINGAVDPRPAGHTGVQRSAGPVPAPGRAAGG